MPQRTQLAVEMRGAVLRKSLRRLPIMTPALGAAFLVLLPIGLPSTKTMVASLVCGVIYGVLQLWVIRKRTLEPYSMINVLPFMIMAFVLNFTTRSEILPLDRSWLAFLQTLQVVTLTLFVGFAVLWSCQRVIQREVDALPRD